MQKRFLTILAMLVLLCVAAAAGAAVAKKPAPKKAAPKPVAKKPAAPTIQLAGNNGVFGTVYKIKNDSPLYFRLRSAEYTTEQLSISETLYVPQAGEKLLVLHFSIQNPHKSEQFVRYDSLAFTAVDSENNNHEAIFDWGDDEAKGHPRIALNLKPAQTINILTAVRVPAAASVPKLMVMPGENNGPVLRYALAPDKTAPAPNKPGPLSAPIADPDDPTGYTARETVPGVIGTAYPYAGLDIAVEKWDFADGKLGDHEIYQEGERFFLVTIAAKNDSSTEQFVRWDTVAPVLMSSDGEELQYIDMFLATANRSYGQNLKPGGEVRVRLLFRVPQDATPKTLALKEGESRTYEFELQ